MDKQATQMLSRLQQVGITADDAMTLRRIAMTLHRWFELECGDSNEYRSWCITRGRMSNGSFEHDDNGTPFLENHLHRENKVRYEAIADRETAAKKRLAKIMERYPELHVYIQTDPRGAPLYVLPPDVTAENYNNGIAVFK